MAKTTKLVRGIHSWIKFQKHQGVESLSIEGKQALADLSQDKNGDTNLILNADKDKVNTVASSVPYLAIAHTTTGTDPNQEKTVTISQDLTQFNLGSDGLIDVSKTETSITLYTTKITEKINEVVTSAVTTKETELKEYVNTTLSAKETELKEFVTDHTAGAVGVSPSYVADEIRKAKEELEAKINEHAGGSSNPQTVKGITNIASGSPLNSANQPSSDSAYKFKLTGLYTMSFRPAFVANISYTLKNTDKTYTTTVYVPEKSSLVTVDGALTFKVAFDSIELIFDQEAHDVTVQGTIFDSVTINNDTFVIRMDTTYIPGETRENTAPVPQ